MNRKNIYIGIALIALIVIGIVCVMIIKKPSSSPIQNEWRPASALSKHQPNISDNSWFWMKNNTIYCGENSMGEADVSTFVASSISPYGKDKNNVYYCTQVVANMDPTTFIVLSGNYGKDASHVVYGGYYLVPGADAATFSIVPSPQSPDNGYAKDKDHVYNVYRALPDADPATFTLSPVAHDKNWIYLDDAIVGPVSLIIDNAVYAKGLPAECNPAGANPINPQPYPTAFSADGSVIGYTNSDAICVIDKKAHTIQNFPYGFAESVSLSKDGSKVLFFKYQKGDGVDGQTCTDCGQYSLDRATGKVEKLP
jgi:hypothetical protein